MVDVNRGGDKSPPPGQTPFSRPEYDSLTPNQQGQVSYWQGAWNPQVPDASHYPADSAEQRAWQRGRFKAAMEAQEGDD